MCLGRGTFEQARLDQLHTRYLEIAEKAERKASLAEAEAERLEWEAGSAEDGPYETAEAGPSGLHTRRSIRFLEVADETNEAERNKSLALEEAVREAGPSEPTEKEKGKGRGQGRRSKF